MMNRFKRGQGATEYIVVLAIVLMVALVVVGLLGFFPSFSTNTQVTEYTQYWAVQRPLAILDAAQLSSGNVGQNVTLVIENHGISSITVTKVNVSLSPAGSAASQTGMGSPGNVTSVALSPGDRSSIQVWNATVAGNWLGDIIPGVTDGTTVNTDTALFNNNPAQKVIGVDLNQNLQNFTFDAGAGVFTLGNAGANLGNPLLLTSGGKALISR